MNQKQRWISGQPPFAGRTPQRMIAAHISDTPQPLTELRPDVPAALSALVMRCLEKDASARPQSAGEVLGALEAATTSAFMTHVPLHAAV